MSDDTQEPNHTDEEIHDTAISKEAVYDKLRECYDPEIPVNVVDLGLIYGLKIIGGTVDVTMTLTAIGCPVGPEVMAEVEGRVREAEGVEDCTVTLTFDPPWTPARMTEDAKWELGMA
ncbi:MAG TPA: iron-sulfur cluster assembly protein [Ktedonobacterales bacterium]|jgi:metal-sulfur cluster biosynthetic enzyme